MKLFQQVCLLSACAALLLGLAGTACGEEGPSGRAYTVGPNGEIPGVLFPREVDYEEFLAQCGSQELYWSEWDSDVFAIEWNREAFDSAVSGGKTEFSMEGTYALPGDCPEELRALWDAGLVTMPEPPETTVWVRPRDFVTTYFQEPEDLPAVEVYRGAGFEEAVRYAGMVELRQGEEEKVYDPVTAWFWVSWSREDYELGMADGEKTSFEISGSYLGPDDTRLEGWVQAAGAPRLVVNVKQPPAEAEVYYDPAYGGAGAAVRTLYVTPDADFDALALPNEVTLMRLGQSGNYRDFAVTWNRDEFEAGLASGADSFAVHGSYGPGASWPQVEQEWWGSLILLEEGTPDPQLTVHVVREKKYPFTADIVNEGDLVPLFTFPWLNGAEEVACAFSLDDETWYQEATDWAWSGDPATGRVAFTVRIYDDDYDILPIPPDAAVYVKLIVTGSALAGETDVFVLKPPADGGGSWDMTPYDDQGGDHGGGGQGEHDRPGREDGSSGAVSGLTFRELLKMLKRLLPAPAPAPVQPLSPPEIPEPSYSAAPAPEPEERPAPSKAPEPADSAAPAPAGRPQKEDGGQAARLPAEVRQPEAEQALAAAPEEVPQAVPPADASPEAAPSAPGPGPEAAPEPVAVQEGVAVPGYTVAAAATAALILGGAALFCRRDKGK